MRENYFDKSKFTKRMSTADIVKSKVFKFDFKK